MIQPAETADDIQAMQHALQLARNAMFTTAPNPRVGCVIVKNGMVIGEGWTQPPGQAHAEVQALRDAERRGHDVRGAVVYVTLEPCSHYGRTPPCADALVRAGVARVVAAIEDPNPLVAGKGLTRLREAGIEAQCGLLRDEARELNIGFFSRMQHGTPWVRLKAAASLDGKTALHNGKSQWITSPEARKDGHEWRARACAILTGVGTVEHDDPQLNVREIDTPRQPQRIVIDSRLRIDPSAKVLASGGTWIFAAQENPEKERQLSDAGAEIVMLPDAEGRVDLAAVMHELGKREINELHVEAGSRLNGAMLKAQCVDELLLYLAPCVIGDAHGIFELDAIESLEQKRKLAFHDVKTVGPDLRILARFLS